MAATKCKLTRADEPACQAPATVTIIDTEGKPGRGCLNHAIRALDAITGSHVDWSRTKVNEYGKAALELSGGRR